jgi:hypothetical protein
VEDQQLCRSGRLQGLPPVTLEPPPPPLRHRLDQEGSFEASRPQETIPEPAPREDFPAPEESTISDLEVEGFRPANPLITDLSAPLLIQTVPPEVTSLEHQFVRRAAMEATSATSSGSPRTPISAAMGGGVMPPPPPPLIRTTVVQTPTTSSRGTIPSTTLTTVPSIQNVFGAPFSYGMSGFNSCSVLTYSTLQIIGLGAGSSNAPLQGSVAGTTVTSTLSLTVGVISLRPLRSKVLSSSRSGLTPTLVYSVGEVMDLNPT